MNLKKLCIIIFSVSVSINVFANEYTANNCASSVKKQEATMVELFKTQNKLLESIKLSPWFATNSIQSAEKYVNRNKEISQHSLAIRKTDLQNKDYKVCLSNSALYTSESIALMNDIDKSDVDLINDINRNKEKLLTKSNCKSTESCNSYLLEDYNKKKTDLLMKYDVKIKNLYKKYYPNVK